MLVRGRYTIGVEFRLLGDVDVLLDGRPLDVGHNRQRAVLAVLLVELNRVVPAERLIDRVWADRPPYRARNAVSAYISRLRQRLRGASQARLARGPGGYALAADPLTVDLHAFRHQVELARSADRPVDAADRYDTALSRWRGTPFAVLDTPWFDDLRTSLQAERRAATLDRNDAALAAGRHADLLAELEAEVRTHPLDERLAGQLMLAQYRSGRQADAFDTYQRMHDRLRDELGTDPGAALREAHRRILSGDPAPPLASAVRRAAPSRPPPSGPAPSDPGRCQESHSPGVSRPESGFPGMDAPPLPGPGGLPRRPTRFVGRRNAVDRIADAIGGAVGDGPLVTLTGVGGVGKTRLALEVTDRVRHRFGDGAWLCELAAVDDPAAVGHAVAAALRVQQRHGLTIDASVVEYLRGRELLLVLDNCEHVLDAAAGLVDAVVHSCPGVTVLATSREPLGVAGERVLPVEPLSVEDATELFADRAGAQRPGFDPATEGARIVGEICRRLDGLPLAIELAAARMRVMNAAEVLDRMERGQFVGTASRSAPPRHQSLAAALDWSYRLLSTPERALFARLSVFAGGFDLDAAHGVCGDPSGVPDDTLDQLIGLVDKSMVTVLSTSGRTRYRVLETLRAYGRERLREAGEDAVLGRRHAEFFATLAEDVARGLHGPDERAWVERALPDYDNLRAAFERAVADGAADTALRLVTAAAELVHLRVGYEVAGWAERALELADDAHPLTPAALGVAARGAGNRGDFAAARTLARRARGVPGRGTDRVAYPGDVLADVALYEGDAAAALRHYRGEVERARRERDPIRLVWTLYYMAVCRAVLRDPDAGVAAAVESVEVAEQTGNTTARSMARYALGLVLKKSEPSRALALLDEAAELAASVRNFWWHGIALMEAAATRAVHGDPLAAAGAFVEVLDHWDRVGDWTQQWLNLRYVDRLLTRLGAAADAVALHQTLVASGHPSPLEAGNLAALAAVLGPDTFAEAAGRGAAASGAAAVVRARAALRGVSSAAPAPPDLDLVRPVTGR